MIEALMGVLVAGGVLAVFLTMGPGQQLVKRLGVRRLQKGAAPDEDREYLLQACDGDAVAVANRLDAVRVRYPDWTEAQLYRRAIRTVMNERSEATDHDQVMNERSEVTDRDTEAEAADRATPGPRSER